MSDGLWVMGWDGLWVMSDRFYTVLIDIHNL